MNFNAIFTHDVDQNGWNTKLLQRKSSLVYQTSNWQLAFRGGYSSKPVFIYVVNDQDKTVGQLAAIIHQKWFWQDANIFSKTIGGALGLGKVLHWFYGPIIYDKDNEEKIISTMIETLDMIAKENAVVLIKGTSSPLAGEPANKSFENYNYDLKPGATFIIDLKQGSENLYGSLKKDIRYYIRRSEKMGYQFEIVNNKDILHEFHDMKIEANKEEGRRPVRNKIFVDTNWELLHKKGFAQLFIARFKGKNVGGILTLNYNKNMIQHALVNSPEHDLVGTFLTWNIIKWAMKMNLETFDFAGVNPNPKTTKEKGIYYYASKWGGNLYNYTVYTKILDSKKHKITSFLKNPKKIHKIIKKE